MKPVAGSNGMSVDTGFSPSESDSRYMRLALAEAERAGRLGEVPVGAVLVLGEEVLATAGNGPIGLHDPTAHAEIRVLRAAGARVGNYRLPGARLYVTLEPCLMCFGAMVHARIETLIYGAPDPRTGAVHSLYQLASETRLNHRIECRGGMLAQEAGDRLRAFFRERRSGDAKAQDQAKTEPGLSSGGE